MNSVKNAIRIFPLRAVKGGMYLLFMWGLLCYTVLRFSGYTQYDATEDRETTAKLLNVTEDRETTAKLLLRQVLPSDATPTASRVFNKILEEEPSIDNSPKLSEDELIAKIQKKMPNLPIKFWKEHRSVKLAKNKTCAKFPSPYEINYDNLYWQKMTTSNGSFHLLAAYYDNRTLLANVPTIRILGMINRIKPAVKTHCQFWFDGYREPFFSPVLKYRYMWIKGWGNYKNGLYQPYLINCNVPAEHKHMVPVSVSLVENPCDMAKTNLRVIYNQPPSGEKEDFAVCVKGFDFPHDDLSVQIVEWLEVLFILGANKVYMYDLEIHPNVSKVLDYYEKRGLVEVTKLTLPGTQPNVPDLLHMYLKSKMVHKRQNEVIPYNDCFYRNMYKYKYITLLDTDEVIMPRNARNWTELMAIVVPKAEKGRSSYIARNVYFLDVVRETYGWFPDIPHYMKMMQNVYRSTNYTQPGAYIKAFHSTEHVMSLHNHFPFNCLGACHGYSMLTEDAHLQHYRRECVGELKKSCEINYKKYITIDKSIWRFKEPLIKSITNTLKQLGFLSYDDSLASASSIK